MVGGGTSSGTKKSIAEGGARSKASSIGIEDEEGVKRRDWQEKS